MADDNGLIGMDLEPDWNIRIVEKGEDHKDPKVLSKILDIFFAKVNPAGHCVTRFGIILCLAISKARVDFRKFKLALSSTLRSLGHTTSGRCAEHRARR